MGSIKPKVVVISDPSPAGEDYVRNFKTKFDLHIVTPVDRKTTIERLATAVKKHGPFEAIIILFGLLPYEPLDAELLQPLVPDCKIMGSASAGFNEFDVDWMSRNGIIFCNSRNAVNEPTADLAIFFMLAITRDVQTLQTSIDKGTWRGKYSPTRDPNGMTLGIIGMGSIGKLVARKAKVFNMRIIYYQRTRLSAEDEETFQATYCSTLDELLGASDVVSVHCPLNDKTKGLISHKEFAKMKDGVFLVNTSRGPVVDEDALISALESGKVLRAGLDVFKDEPNINPYFVRNDRVFIQPHMGGLSEVGKSRGYREAMENVRSYLETGKAISPVNLKDLQR